MKYVRLWLSKTKVDNTLKQFLYIIKFLTFAISYLSLTLGLTDNSRFAKIQETQIQIDRVKKLAWLWQHSPASFLWSGFKITWSYLLMKRNYKTTPFWMAKPIWRQSRHVKKMKVRIHQVLNGHLTTEISWRFNEKPSYIGVLE